MAPFHTPAEGQGARLTHNQPTTEVGYHGLAQPASQRHPRGDKGGGDQLGLTLIGFFSHSQLAPHLALFSSPLLLDRHTDGLRRPLMPAPWVMAPTTRIDLASLCLCVFGLELSRCRLRPDLW
jgi:hypothetical protein